MKRIFTTLAQLLIITLVIAQSPEKMSYQAVVRDASNNLVTNSGIGMRISILIGSSTGMSVYTETQTTTTNANGLVSIEIGTGTTGDDFSAINWGAYIYFIKTETDPTGGSNYTITGTTQLLSVPYALHAKTAANTFSGNYSDLIGSPINVSDFFNDAGYLVSFTEDDPVFGAHVANGITSTNMTNWNTAYGWGDHSTQGYLASFTETDPVFGAHVANGITSTNTTNWNTAYGWGDHSTQGYLSSFTESDPKVGTNTTNYLSKWDGDALVSSSIFDNGNVGIGTTETSQKLEVNGNILANEFYSGPNSSANYHKYRLNGTVTGYAIGMSSNDHVGFVNAWSNTFTWRDGEGYGWIWRNQNGIGWMSLNSKEGGFYLKGKAHFGDNVGIGTDSPAARLEVADTPPGTNDPVAIRITNLRSSTDLFWELRAYDSGAGGPYGRFSIFGGQSGGSDKLVVTTTGNVGIGTIDPKTKLQVVGLPEYADNAAAVAAGLTIGAFYRTGDFLKVVH